MPPWFPLPIFQAHTTGFLPPTQDTLLESALQINAKERADDIVERTLNSTGITKSDVAH